MSSTSLLLDAQSLTALEHNGFVVIHQVLNPQSIGELSLAIESVSSDEAAGVRALARKVPAINQLANSAAVRAIAVKTLGPKARLVRSILFTKNEYVNWQVAWHQDLAIAVSCKVEIEGYGGWSKKEEVWHVQPPIEVLENMLTIRLHLDPANESNGALWLSPGSHRLGRLPASEAAQRAQSIEQTLCAVNAGDALLLRPLTLHSSRKTVSNAPRRVIHLEYSSMELPKPLDWAEALI
jgi:ectoine hydroxylase-related dioxygenase (phytanoyl-CoA dioxygenase family)